MLKSQNVQKVLSQAVQQDRKGSTIISGILITTSGRPVSSFHNTRSPPVPHTSRQSDEEGSSAPVSSASSQDTDTSSNNPYQVDRLMKTKVYGLFAASLWDEYLNASPTGANWTSITTDDALLVIRPINLEKSSQTLLLVLVADPVTPLGIVVKKSEETGIVLSDGLSDFRYYE